TQGVPRQEILPVAAARLELSVATVSEADLDAALAAAAGRGFDLDRELPLRAHVFVLSPTAHVLLLVLHHIAGDGWSLGVLGRDLAAFYAARREGRAPDLPALGVQYADYTLWQQALLGEESEAGSAMARQLGYWREALAGLPDQLDLPTDRPRPAGASYPGAHGRPTNPAGLPRALVALSPEAGAGPVPVLAARLS